MRRPMLPVCGVRQTGYLYRMKQMLFACLCILVDVVNAQLPQAPELNTAAGNIAAGKPDPYWQAASGDTLGPSSPFEPALVIGNCGNQWFNAGSLAADWITCNQGNGCNHVGSGADYYFRRKIVLPETNDCGRPVGDVFCVEMTLYADNCIQSVMVNGIPNYQYQGRLCDNLQSPVRVQICRGWQSGENELLVHVKSSPPAVGFLAVATRKPVFSADFLGKDTVLCAGMRYNIVSSSEQTLWFDYTIGKSKTVDKAGLYWASRVTEDGCELLDTVRVDYNQDFYIPNAFSPGADGLNNIFAPAFGAIPPSHFQMEVFDRWGTLVYKSELATEGWDGNFRSKPCPAGVYMYRLVAGRAPCQIRKNGGVLLLR